MFMDWQTMETKEGYHDIILPLTKITQKSQLLFQEVDLLLDTWTGEFLYNIENGIPYEPILEGMIPLDRIEPIYFNQISKLKNFLYMDDFKATMGKNRELTVSMCITSIYDDSRYFVHEVLIDSKGVVLNDANKKTLTS